MKELVKEAEKLFPYPPGCKCLRAKVDKQRKQWIDEQLKIKDNARI